MRVLFIHGGGDDAYRYDSDIVERLREALGSSVQLEYPRIEGLERIEWGPTFDGLSKRLMKLPPGTAVIAHSVGAAAVLKILSTSGDFPVRNLFLLAPPYKGEDSHWGVDDFTLPTDFPERLARLHVSIYHSKEDDIIPVNDALLYKGKMSTANITLLDGYGHQFSGPLEFLANDIRSAMAR